MTEADERHQRRTPVVPSKTTRIPAPSARAPKPAPVVVGSPAPRVAAHPRPAIPAEPRPPPHAIRRPPGHHGGTPDRAVLRVGLPRAVAIQVFRAVDVTADVLVGVGAFERLVAVVVPMVPIVGRRRGIDLKLGIGGGAAG